MTSRRFEMLVSALILLNFCAFIAESALDAPELASAFQLVDVSFAFAFGLELLCKLGGLGVGRFFAADGWNRLDFLLVVGGLVSAAFTLAQRARTASVAGSLLGTLGALRVVRLLRLLRAVRLLRLFRRPMRTLSLTFWHMLPVFLSICALALAVTAAFATVGTELLSQALTCAPRSEVALCLSFETWDASMRVLFLIVVGNNWPQLMYQAMEGLRAAALAAGKSEARAVAEAWVAFWCAPAAGRSHASAGVCGPSLPAAEAGRAAPRLAPAWLAHARLCLTARSPPARTRPPARHPTRRCAARAQVLRHLLCAGQPAARQPARRARD